MDLGLENFDRITSGLPTKSEKIRALAREGAATADIARYLGIKYQHARNVLVQAGLHNRRDDARPAAGTSGGASATGGFGWVTMDALGRLQIPAALLKQAGLAGGEPVHIRTTNDGLEILSRRAAIRRAHDIAKQFVPEGTSLADELIAERRHEAEREHG